MHTNVLFHPCIVYVMNCRKCVDIISIILSFVISLSHLSVCYTDLSGRRLALLL